MGLYEGIKDAIGLAQKADNIDLYKQLLDLGAQALDMQAEITRLREENAELKKGIDIENQIIRHPQGNDYPYITLSNDSEKIRYCAICWGRERKLIQLYSKGACMECSIKRNNS